MRSLQARRERKPHSGDRVGDLNKDTLGLRVSLWLCGWWERMVSTVSPAEIQGRRVGITQVDPRASPLLVPTLHHSL